MNFRTSPSPYRPLGPSSRFERWQDFSAAAFEDLERYLNLNCCLEEEAKSE